MTGDQHLFESNSHLMPFPEIRDEMNSVHDLVCALMTAEQAIVREMIEERDRLLAGERLVVDDYDYTDDVLPEYDAWRIPHARRSALAMSEGAGLLLVFAFLERGLRAVCEELESDGRVLKQFLKADKKKEQGRSTIDGYIAFLQDAKRLVFETPSTFERIRSREREVRNAFAHGDWDLTYLVAQEGEALSTLFSLTALFERIERVFVKQRDNA
jgi:hypothetical protein